MKQASAKGKPTKKKKAKKKAKAVPQNASRRTPPARKNSASNLTATEAGDNPNLPPLWPQHWAILNSAMHQLKALGITSVAATARVLNPDNPPLPPLHPGHLAIIQGAIDNLRSLDEAANVRKGTT